MTSTPVKDVRFLVNFVGLEGAPAPEKTGTTTDFGDIMGRLANRASELKNPANRENLIKQAPVRTEKPNDNSLNTSDAQKNGETEAKKVPFAKEAEKAPEEMKTGETSKIDDQTMEKINEAVQEAVNAVAEMVNKTPEEVLAALTALGMILESLLDPKNLGEVIVMLEGTDMLTLMTDEGLYQSLNDLTAVVTAITGGLAEETGLSPEELSMLAKQLANTEGTDEAEIDPGKLTKLVNLTNETAAAKDAEPEQQITIVVEKDGVITEVVAKADENGNIKATKEVATTETEPQIVIDAKDSSGNQPKQSGSGQGEQNLSGQEALLNSLLQNRASVSEVNFEPVVLETPNTEMIMRQIMDFMKIQLRPEIDSIEMQLHPASLGTVGVKIISTAGVITAQFTAQNEIVKAAIESQIVELKDNMRAQGIKVETVEVNVKSQEFDSKLWQGQDENTREEQNARRGRRRINLSGLDELPEDMTGDDKLTAEMMIENGQTVDFSA